MSVRELVPGIVSSRYQANERRRSWHIHQGVKYSVHRGRNRTGRIQGIPAESEAQVRKARRSLRERTHGVRASAQNEIFRVAIEQPELSRHEPRRMGSVTPRRTNENCQNMTVITTVIAESYVKHMSNICQSYVIHMSDI